MLEATGLTKRYGGTLVLHPLTLRVEPGRTLAVIGPSGSGKSTLLRLLAGLDAPSAGGVRFGGQALGPGAPAALRRNLGYVVQGGGLFPHLTAGANVEVVARHLGWPAARRQERMDALARLVRLEADALGRYPVQLSGGQAQRVSLMRALMLEPEALLLDEPLGALDPITRHELQTDLRDVFARVGKAVVLVTHDLAEAVFFADRVLLLRDGRVAQDGPPAELLERPADDFVRRFVSAQRSPLEALARGGPR